LEPDDDYYDNQSYYQGRVIGQVISISTFLCFFQPCLLLPNQPYDRETPSIKFVTSLFKSCQRKRFDGLAKRKIQFTNQDIAKVKKVDSSVAEVSLQFMIQADVRKPEERRD
jgi:hypothetical protein